ncbi:MAG: oligosaccharide flippase family protein, partial [Marinoscillum sp.]
MKSLKKRTTSALAWDIGGTMLRQTFNFVTSIFLARLLTPEEFGLVGMSMVFIAFAEVFIDVGFSSALIQNQKNSELTYNSVFFINIGAGFLLTIVFYLSAPLIGRFYNNMEVVGLVRWLSLIFVFNSANLVQVAILKKKLNLKIMNVRTSIGAMIGGIAGVASAFAGLGVYSLVIQHITMAVAGTLLLWTTAGWLPKMEFSWREVKNLTGFSTYIFMDRIFS